MKKLLGVILAILAFAYFIHWGTVNGTGTGFSSNSSNSSNTSTKTNSSYSSGDRITLSDDAPVCTSKENVRKMISYVQKGNKAGQEEMLKRGQATILYKGTEINIIKSGTITEIETKSGLKYFAPREAIK